MTATPSFACSTTRSKGATFDPENVPLVAIHVGGNKFYTANQVIGAAGVKIGQKMKAADFDAMKTRLISGRGTRTGSRTRSLTPRNAPASHRRLAQRLASAALSPPVSLLAHRGCLLTRPAADQLSLTQKMSLVQMLYGSAEVPAVMRDRVRYRLFAHRTRRIHNVDEIDPSGRYCPPLWRP